MASLGDRHIIRMNKLKNQRQVFITVLGLRSGMCEGDFRAWGSFLRFGFTYCVLYDTIKLTLHIFST
jgi:hypothetical protein